MSPPPVPTAPLPGPDWHAAVTAALTVLQAGGLVAYPSETVWGLAVHPESRAAVQRLWEVKGRDPAKPLQVSCASAAAALWLAQPDPALDALAELWPGPLTVVTPASAACPPALAPQGRVGLRVPDHPVALELLARAGGVLVTTSCNRSGEAPALSRPEALTMELADVVLPDTGVPAGGQASTVVLLPEGLILRRGSVTEERIRSVLRGVSGAPNPGPA